MTLHELDKNTLLKLIESYDAYIQDANDENRYEEGWLPVCIEEYLNCEFAELEEEE